MRVWALELITIYNEWPELREFAGVFATSEEAKADCPSKGKWDSLNRLLVPNVSPVVKQWWVVYEIEVGKSHDVTWLYRDIENEYAQINEPEVSEIT